MSKSELSRSKSKIDVYGWIENRAKVTSLLPDIVQWNEIEKVPWLCR